MYRVCLMVASMLVFAASASYGIPPCDPAPGEPGSEIECQSGFGLSITVHKGNFDCFRFSRQECGQSEWVLVYEGPSNSITDCGYDQSKVYRYKVQRFWGIEGSRCSDFNDECESLWWTGIGQIADCP